MRTTVVGMLCCLATLGLASGCSAPPPPAQIDVENSSPEQINAANALDVVHSYAVLEEDPEARSKAVAEAPRRFTLEVRLSLAALYYPVNLGSQRIFGADSQLRAHVRSFEQRLLDQLREAQHVREIAWVRVDGNLTWYEFNELTRIARLSKTTPIVAADNDEAGLPYVSFFEMGSYGFATARGSWELDGEQLAFPIHWVQIDCDLIERECTVMDTDVAGPSAAPSGFGLPWYQVHTPTAPNRFEITRWNNRVIEARSVPSQLNEDCRISTLTINERLRNVSLVTQNGERPCMIGDRALPRLERPRVATLRTSNAVLSAHMDRLFRYVERFHGPLAEFGYTRPFTGLTESTR